MTTILKYVKPAHAVKSIVCLVLCETSDDQVLLDTRVMIHIEAFEESLIFQQAFNLTILTMYYNRVNF